jgi:hypothetical protein
MPHDSSGAVIAESAEKNANGDWMNSLTAAERDLIDEAKKIYRSPFARF